MKRLDQYKTADMWCMDNWYAKEILQDISNGMAYSEICKKRNVAISFIKATVRRSKKSLCANSTPHMIAIAMREGIVR